MMKNLKHVLLGTLTVLTVLFLTGCWQKDHPVRTSLNVDTSTLTLAVGESATRTATTKAQWDYQITYTSSNPAVATVDQTGKVTAVSEGEAVITVSMDETIKSWYAAAIRTYNVVVKEKEPGPAPVVTVTDLSMVDCAGNARATMSTANCYMVHTAGDYKLPLVYGNAIKDGAANTAAYTGITNTNTTATFPNHAGNAIDAPWITKATTGTGADKGMGIVVSTAELLWQDAQGLITAVGIIGDYLTLTVGKNASEQEGNAVIAAKDAGGNIVWSWHIWVTKETFATLTTITTTDDTSIGTQGVNWQIYKVTSVNLGWVATGGDGKQGYNTYYQWGRKDAFIPGTWNANTNRTVYDISNTPVPRLTYEASTTATIADNIKNPTTHYFNSSTKGPCDTQYYNMWDARQTLTGNIKTATKKTVYDPCPAGFCVPTGNLYYFMCNGISRSELNWDATNKGKTWRQTTYSSNTTGPDLYFPASGYRHTGSGALSTVGSLGSYWSASLTSGIYSRYLRFNAGYWYYNNYVRAYGIPVRAVAEE